MSGFYRCEIKVIGRAGGQSASAAHSYDVRARHSDKSDVQSTGQTNMPDWADKPGVYWAAADQFERANGSLARRAILSFPIELPPGAREQVIREWLARNCPNMPASWAVHDSGDGNPHAHALISERQVDGIERSPELWFKRFNRASPDKGGAEKADLGSRRKEWLDDARKSWAEVLNKHLPACAQVDHRSHKDRGIIDRRDPQPKFGAKVLAVEQKGIRTRLVSRIIEDHAQHCSIRCLTFTGKDGREVTFRAAVEREDRIDLVGKPSKSKCIEIVKACKSKGWVEVEVTGSAEFQQMMKAELRRAGILIQGEKNYEQNSEHRRGAYKGSSATDGGQSRDGRADRPAPGRGRYEPDRGLGQRPAVVDGGAGTHDERPTPEAPASPEAPATAVPAPGRDRAADRAADLKFDIRTLAGQTDGVPSGQKPGSNMQKDLTAIQVRKQLASMSASAVDSFDIGIRDSRSGKFTNVQMDRAGVIEAVDRLKRENARGCDIYVRPEPSKPHPFIMLDDVNAGSIDQMKRDGLTPVLQIETSPLNYQVLLKLPERLDRHVRKATERVLSGRYGSDLNSADGGHYMRLAGFTNRKPNHVGDDGRFPFVKLSMSTEAVVPPEVWGSLHAEALDRLTDDLAPQAHSSAAQPLGGGCDVVCLCRITFSTNVFPGGREMGCRHGYVSR